MADAELKVRIEAEMAGLAKGLNASVKLVDNAGSQISKSVQGLSTSFKTLNNTKFTFGQNYISASKSLATEAQKTGAALGGSMTVGSNRAAFALTNLGRVAQDAPFGFIGIQNNLNPLLESFQNLRKETGSNVSAFKALAGGLVGPAGLGLALSLVSAGILLYQEYTRKANKETRVMADANKELADSIKDISGVQAEGRANASKDLSQLQSLYNATQNVNIPAKERLRIANDLIKRYPEYLKGFNAEEILAGKAAASYTKLTNAILAKGYAQAAEENRQKLINQQLNAKVELIKEQSKLEIAAAELLKRTTQKQATLDIQGQAALENGINRVSDAVDQSKGKINELNKVYSDSAKEIKILDNVTQGLIKTYGASVVIDPIKVGSSNKDLKTQSDVSKQLAIDLLKVKESVDITFGEGNKQKVTAFAKAIDSLTEIGGDKTVINKLQNDLLNINPAEITAAGKMIGVTLSTGIASGFSAVGGVIAPQLNSSLGYINQQLIDFNSQASDIINGSIVNTFAGIGQAIGESISTGASLASTLGQVLLSSLGSVLGQLGQLAIATGVAILGIKLSLKSLNPVAAIAAGVALLALSGVVRGAANKIGGGVGGAGGSTSPQPAYSASSGTSSYSASSGGGGSGTVVFEISGTNLVGVLNRAGAKLQRFGP